MSEWPDVPNIGANLRAVRERIATAARAAGRDPRDVTLIAVSKTMPAEAVAAAVAAGVEVFGENRVQEAEEKIPAVRHLLTLTPPAGGQAPQWHLIGHLQTNKVKAAMDLFDVFESVDSLRLADALHRRASASGHCPGAFLEVNVAGELSKGGFTPAELRESAAALARLDGLRWSGLMTVAPLTADTAVQQAVFRDLRLLFEQLAGVFPAPSWRHLSMGMSNDFEAAIAEGATMVRIGRAIFGERS